jgi:diphosphomevalonate decarboxylase
VINFERKEQGMPEYSAAAQANPNIAFIKYWGDLDNELHIPAGPSLSMNLDGLETRTHVTFDSALPRDRLILNGQEQLGPGLQRVQTMLDRVRKLSGMDARAVVESANNFPVGAGIASSASAFAALALAATTAAGLTLSEKDLSRLARSGSGSACRSIPQGFVEWQAGSTDEDSYAFSIAPPDQWDLVDLVAVVSTGHKQVVSAAGHALAKTSPLQSARLEGAVERLQRCRTAIFERDFAAFAEVVELDSNLMHAVMITSDPPLLYWKPATLEIMRRVTELRQDGLPACYTIDAGPNVHVITLASFAGQVKPLLERVEGVKHVLSASPGGAAKILEAG